MDGELAVTKKRVLGRGLDALIPDMAKPISKDESFFECDTDSIRPNPYQPRKHFSEHELRELSSSIREKGVIQPLVVRRAAVGYELIVGERRWRASRLAGIKRIPVVVKDVSKAEMLELALIENIQREDLNPLEKANAYYRLTKEFGLTQQELAERLGQDRSTVTNFLRLRNLPDSMQADIANNKLGMGQARALLGCETPAQQREAWRRIVSGDLSVRAAEALVRKLKAGKAESLKKKAPTSEETYIESLAEDLTRHLGTKVTILRRGKRGRLEIEFYTDDDLDRLISLLRGS
jgi:ParB family chromosome partitioning protein